MTRFDVVVVGAGIAGLMTALASAPRRVAVLTKSSLGTGAATAWAQGGIAAAVGADDSPELHAADTLAAAGGIAEAHAVEILTREATARIDDLVRLGAAFDRSPDGALALGREGAHTRRRILHAGGDATGRVLLDALARAVRATPSIRVFEGVTVLDLLRREERVVGVSARAADGTPCIWSAPAVVLATGGVGGLYASTTNPPEACGEGLAMAMRAGASLADVEFVQFHPTALDVGRDPMPLLTEALRGEGALLVNERGERLMAGVHPLAELAPRDVVARALYERRRAGERVLLDARGIAHFAGRFPTAAAACAEAGIDPAREPIPTAPAAHYHMGGIAVNEWGRTSLPGLWACGEVAATGVHGANRLASNSLLEGIVFAERVARDIGGTPFPLASRRAIGADAVPVVANADATEIASIVELRRVMDERVGVLRDREGLCAALEMIERIAARTPGSRAIVNRASVMRAIVEAALARPETRGSHARRDHPDALEEYAHRSFIASPLTHPVAS